MITGRHLTFEKTLRNFGSLPRQNHCCIPEVRSISLDLRPAKVSYVEETHCAQLANRSSRARSISINGLYGRSEATIKKIKRIYAICYSYLELNSDFRLPDTRERTSSLNSALS